MLKRAGETGLGIMEDHEGALAPHLPEALAVLLKGGNLLHIPTNSGWTESKTGSGCSGNEASYQYVGCGATANSRGMLYCFLQGFGSPTGHYAYLDFSKKLYFIFNYARAVAEANATCRVQIKQANTEGVLASKGVGLQVTNLALTGESYGTSRGTVDLGTTLTNTWGVQIVIILYPGSRVEWFVNGTLKGTQTTAANIPGAVATGNVYLVHSIVNSASPSAEALSVIFQPRVWQER